MSYNRNSRAFCVLLMVIWYLSGVCVSVSVSGNKFQAWENSKRKTDWKFFLVVLLLPQASQHSSGWASGVNGDSNLFAYGRSGTWGRTTWGSCCLELFASSPPGSSRSLSGNIYRVENARMLLGSRAGLGSAVRRLAMNKRNCCETSNDRRREHMFASVPLPTESDVATYRGSIYRLLSWTKNKGSIVCTERSHRVQQLLSLIECPPLWTTAS